MTQPNIVILSKNLVTVYFYCKWKSIIENLEIHCFSMILTLLWLMKRNRTNERLMCILQRELVFSFLHVRNWHEVFSSLEWSIICQMKEQIQIYKVHINLFLWHLLLWNPMGQTFLIIVIFSMFFTHFSRLKISFCVFFSAVEYGRRRFYIALNRERKWLLNELFIVRKMSLTRHFTSPVISATFRRISKVFVGNLSLFDYSSIFAWPNNNLSFQHYSDIISTTQHKRNYLEQWKNNSEHCWNYIINGKRFFFISKLILPNFQSENQSYLFDPYWSI